MLRNLSRKKEQQYCAVTSSLMRLLPSDSYFWESAFSKQTAGRKPSVTNSFHIIQWF